MEQPDGTPKEYLQIIIEAICKKVGDFYSKPDVFKNTGNGQFISNGHFCSGNKKLENHVSHIKSCITPMRTLYTYKTFMVLATQRICM